MYECKLKGACDHISRYLALAGGVGLTLMMLIVFANILTRKILNYPIFGTTELVRYLSLFVGSVGLFRLEWNGGNIRMTLVVDSVKKRTAHLLEFIANALGAIGFAGVTWFLTKQVVVKITDGSVTENLRLPMFIPYGVLALGFAVLAVCIAIKAALYLLSYLKHADLAPEAAEGGDAPDISGV